MVQLRVILIIIFFFQSCKTFEIEAFNLSNNNKKGWTATALPILMNENTPLTSGPLKNSEASWVGSINCIGNFQFVYFEICVNRSYDETKIIGKNIVLLDIVQGDLRVHLHLGFLLLI